MRILNALSKPTRSQLLVSACFGICATAIGVFALSVTLRYDEKRSLDLQGLTDKAASTVLARDIDDLEAQLQQSLKSQDALKGTFEIYPSKNGLTATHTSAPVNPLEIDSSGQPFAASLDLDPGVGFMIFTSEGGMISQLARRPSESQVSFFVSHILRSLKTRDFYVRSTPAGTELIGGKLRPWDILKMTGLHRVQIRPINKTNLVTASVVSLDPVRARALRTARAGAFAIGALWLFGLAVGQFFESRRRRTLAWVRDTMAGFRFGRMNAPQAPRWTSPLDRALVAELQAQFSSQSPFSPFYSGRWLNPALRIATWLYFRETISLWSVGKKENRDVLLGDDWYVARIALSKPTLVEAAVRIFGRAFALKTYVFYQYSETEILIAARTANFEEWFDGTKTALKALVEFGALAATDVAFEGVHVPGHVPAQSDLVLQRLKLDAPLELATRRLTDATARFMEMGEGAPVVETSWVQNLAVSSESARELFAMDKAVSQTASVLARAKPVRLPPTPVTSTPVKEKIGTPTEKGFRPRSPKISV